MQNAGPQGGGTKSLYEDWLLRRQSLETPPAGQPPAAFASEQIKVLAFLLSSYRDHPEAQRPAAFPVRSELYLNNRAILVHHHLKPETTEAPGKRARSILQRISNQDPQASASAPAEGSAVKGHSAVQRDHPFSVFPFQDIMRRERDKVNWAFDRADAALKETPTLPEDVVQVLAAFIAQPRAVELLSRCENASVVPYAMDAWRRERTTTVSLEIIFFAERHRAVSLHSFREELANPNPTIRLRALEMVEKLGSLADIGLLLDLLKLPPASDDLPGERERLIHAVEKLSGMR